MSARRWAVAAVACCGVLLGPAAPAGATILWEAGMDGGDLSEWEGGFQAADRSRVPVVTNRFLSGGKALALEVRDGDQGPGVCESSCERTQIGGPAIFREGDENWTAVGFYVPRDYPAAETDDERFFQTSWQFYGDSSVGSTPLEFGIARDAKTIEVARSWWPGTDGQAGPGQTHERLASIAFSKGVWQKFVWHVRWSSDDDTGFVELYHAPAGQSLRQVVRRTYGATLTRQNTGGLDGRAANYRRARSGLGTTRVYFDAIRTATTFEEATDAFGDLEGYRPIATLASAIAALVR